MVAGYIAATVDGAFGRWGRGIAEDVIAGTQRVQNELGRGREVYGLIHADLHQDNYFFHRGQVRAIDFDDCGWGHYAYDLSVTLSEVRARSGYAALRAALLRGYGEARLFAVEHEPHLETFYRLRLLQLILWFIEQRDHPAFANWETEARNGSTNWRCSRGNRRVLDQVKDPRDVRRREDGRPAPSQALLQD